MAIFKRPTFSDALHQLERGLGRKHGALPRAVAGVVGELHGVDRPDFKAQALQWEHGGSIANMPIRDPGLDREDVFGCLEHGA